MIQHFLVRKSIPSKQLLYKMDPNGSDQQQEMPMIICVSGQNKTVTVEDQASASSNQIHFE